MLQALCDFGDDSKAYRVCEHAYASGADLVDYESVKRGQADGSLPDLPPLQPWDARRLTAAFERLAAVLARPNS